MTVSVWQEVPEPIQAEHDDVVIGAGIVGSYTATLLRERGRDVALVDARFPAAGASGRNAGFVLTAQRETYPVLIKQMGREAAREILTMVRENVVRMRSLANRFDVPLEDGAAHLAETRAEARELERWARELEADGVTVEFSHGEPYGSSGYAAMMQVENDFMVQPARLTDSTFCALNADNRLIKSRFDELVLIPAEAQNGQRPHSVDSLFGRGVRPLGIGRRLLPVPKHTARNNAGSFTVHKNTSYHESAVVA